jgi:hypothetical protein
MYVSWTRMIIQEIGVKILNIGSPIIEIQKL